MTQFQLKHDLDEYNEFVEPDFIKKINERLSVSLSYLKSSNDSETECLLSFHNTLNNNIIVNPGTNNGKVSEENQSWFNNIFGSSEQEPEMKEEEPLDNNIKIFLGYIQLFGYVVLNYKFEEDSSFSTIDISSENSSWWANREYAQQYQDNEAADEDDIRNSKLDNVPFIKRNLKERMIIGGKLGGVNDLVINESQNGTGILNKHDNKTIDPSNRYLLQDLLFPFNSIKTPNISGNHSEQDKNFSGKNSIKELTDSIVPFYTTSQYLLFSDLSLPQLSTKTFLIKFPKDGSLVPSYNSRMSRPVCDQGWISIKYLLVVGLLEMLKHQNSMKPYSIYFPLEIGGERQGTHERWLQPNYLKGTRIDHDWKVRVNDERNSSSEDNSQKEDTVETRNVFLSDLSKLIESDLYNMPKISTNERKKSVHNEHDVNEEIKEGLIPQLPHHLKTQYQIRVNDHQLCLLSISKPYFHIGEDVYFMIDTYPEEVKQTKIVGLIVHLESHETYHVETEDGEKHDYKNIYKVSSNLKFNSFASSMANSKLSENKMDTSLIHGMINIPRYLNQQFQSSEFMDLKHYLVFKFNLNEFETNSENNQQEQEETETLNEADQISETESSQKEDVDNDLNESTNYFQDYRFDNYGGELRFRLPITLLH